jgi:hypothetical protein
VTKKYFKNGKINVAYSKVYDKKYKTYTAQKRPFMKQSLTKAYPSIMKNLQEAIQKDLAKKKKVK